MIRKALAMLFGSRSPQPGHNPDPIRGALTIALQRNETAGANARAALEDLLSNSDRARGVPRND